MNKLLLTDLPKSRLVDYLVMMVSSREQNQTNVRREGWKCIVFGCLTQTETRSHEKNISLIPAQSAHGSRTGQADNGTNIAQIIKSQTPAITVT